MEIFSGITVFCIPRSSSSKSTASESATSNAVWLNSDNASPELRSMFPQIVDHMLDRVAERRSFVSKCSHHVSQGVFRVLSNYRTNSICLDLVLNILLYLLLQLLLLPGFFQLPFGVKY